MPSDYTPTTEQVRNNMALGVVIAAGLADELSADIDWPIAGSRQQAKEAFDRWLESVRAEEREKTEDDLYAAIIAQMELTESRMPKWKHPLTLEPYAPSDEFQRGYREARFKVQHMRGVHQSHRAAIRAAGGTE